MAIASSELVEREIRIEAPPSVVFEFLTDPAKMVRWMGTEAVLEPWPGGRWYRDLGDNNDHFWAVVQAIKRPTLLEFAGPLFMSYPVVSNVQYRLSEVNGGTRIQFRHSALGLIEEDHRKGVTKGWGHIHEGLRKRAEAKRSR